GIIHDLYTPLQNLKLCCEILRRDAEFAKKEDFLQDISSSVEQTISIVEAIRHFLRNPTPGDERTFGEIFENILVILKPKYSQLVLADLFGIESELMESTLEIDPSTGIHILFNLFNCILSHSVDSKDESILIKVKKLEHTSGSFTILIQSNSNCEVLECL